MSQLVQQVSEDLKAAMKAKESQKVAAIRMIRAAFIEAQKAGNGEVTDDDAQKILRRMRKQRVDAAEQYEAAGREDLAEGERFEITVLDDYLPKLADEATTRVWVREVLAATGVTDVKQLGRVMGGLMKAHRTELDAGLARQIIEEELGA
ncbi:MAG: GatB/YqeY domain-containing protein [Alphaproteobacteria bacterium]|nr:GatB/YqeY domain-containing protein [Alphaproteobacteria bacterium]